MGLSSSTALAVPPTVPPASPTPHVARSMPLLLTAAKATALAAMNLMSMR
jgi:hypothetical protein